MVICACAPVAPPPPGRAAVAHTMVIAAPRRATNRAGFRQMGPNVNQIVTPGARHPWWAVGLSA